MTLTLNRKWTQIPQSPCNSCHFANYQIPVSRINLGLVNYCRISMSQMS